jgi:hypothetical protein
MAGIWQWLLRRGAPESSLVEDPPGVERRRSPRYACDIKAIVQPIRLNTSLLYPVQLCNLSRGGVGLLSDEPLPVDHFVAISFRHASEGFVIRLRARVVHSTWRSDGGWLVGCALLAELDDEQLRHLLR